jgi:hypothetical protein
MASMAPDAVLTVRHTRWARPARSLHRLAHAGVFGFASSDPSPPELRSTARQAHGPASFAALAGLRDPSDTVDRCAAGTKRMARPERWLRARVVQV